MTEYWGYHQILDIRQCSKEKIQDKEYLKAFIKELVNKIDMTAFGEPIIEHFATHNEDAAGYSLVQLIETSSITGHFVDKSGDAYLDIFSCKSFEESIVLDLIEKWFSPQDIDSKMLKRSARQPSLVS